MSSVLKCKHGVFYLKFQLDAKKSPLALLAQTCSAIGKDTSPSKSIIPPLEKSTKDNNNEKSSSERSNDSDSSSSSGSKRPSSHGHKDSGRESSNSSSSKPGFRTFPPKEIPPLVPIPGNGENNNGSGKSGRIPSAEPKPATSPLMSAGATSLTVPSSLPRPVSANGAPRTTSRGSSGKGEDHHHHHHNGIHHHQHSSSSHHSQHSSSSSSHHHRHRDSPASSGSSSSSSSTTSSSSSQQPRPSSSPNYSKSSSSQASSVMQSPSSSSSSSAMKQQPPAHASHSSMLGGLPAHLAGYPNPLALMGHGLDASSYHSALAAHSSLSNYSAAAACAAAQSLKAAAAGGGAAALSPFVTYARVRTPSGATTLVPVCRDPYCTNCQLTVQNSHLSSNCNAPGCAQCAHEKSLTSLSALGSLPSAAAASSMLLPPLSSAGSGLSAGSMSALSSLHSLYPHSALAAAAAHQGLPPYVCSWVAGSDYCGKRFNSSEELLQHLRTHTSSLDVSSLAASYAGLGGIPSALAAYPHLSAAPLSPNSLRRAYPTNLSPVSSLLNASRYHPYKSPLSGVGAPPPQSLPPVGPYYSPYTLYGQRIGAAVVP